MTTEVGTVSANPLLEKYPWLPIAAAIIVIATPFGLAMIFGGKKGR